MGGFQLSLVIGFNVTAGVRRVRSHDLRTSETGARQPVACSPTSDKAKTWLTGSTEASISRCELFVGERGLK